MRLYIIRHADPDYANDCITEAGHREAAALAERFARQGLDRIYTSPLTRARLTMQYTADRLGMSHEVLQWTQEMGHLPKLRQHCPRLDRASEFCIWDVHGHTVRGNGRLPTHDDWHTIEPFTAPAYRSEFGQLQQASDAFLATHGFERDGGVYRFTRENRERVAVFCHGGFGLAWLAHLLAVPLPLMWAGFFLWPSSVTTILFDERAPGVAVPRCVGLADLSHLHAAGLPVQPSGVKANVD
jgi:broad specificity phosphatase PhoE